MTIYYNPLNQLRHEMDRLLSGTLGPALEGIWPGALRSQPAVNLWDAGESLKAETELPGVKSEQIDISVLGRELTIRVERPEVVEENVTYHRRERPTGSIHRVLELPCDVKADGVTAEFLNGVLTLTLPKAETAKPRKITVNVNPE
ncbi:MAG: Hsp20/alpha crystallin family protein [Pirellulales bacterium]|nr:Hsp20/alpha crystallin family protein [Pirellulales bacterium]